MVFAELLRPIHFTITMVVKWTWRRKPRLHGNQSSGSTGYPRDREHKSAKKDRTLNWNSLKGYLQFKEIPVSLGGSCQFKG